MDPDYLSFSVAANNQSGTLTWNLSKSKPALRYHIYIPDNGNLLDAVIKSFISSNTNTCTITQKEYYEAMVGAKQNAPYSSCALMKVYTQGDGTYKGDYVNIGGGNTSSRFSVPSDWDGIDD